MEEAYENLINQIDSWDCKDVRALLALIEKAASIREDGYDYLDPIDLSGLPSSEKYTEAIPVHVWLTYPVWAIDDKGFCLVGECACDIEHITIVLEE